MSKSPEAFRTISEVADWLGVQAHVLRFWESKFSQVKPVKRAGGRRYYRPNDMLILGGIRKLLHDDGVTIKGVQKIFREKGVAYVADQSAPLDDLTVAEIDAEAAPATEVTPEEATLRPAELEASGGEPAPVETAEPIEDAAADEIPMPVQDEERAHEAVDAAPEPIVEPEAETPTERGEPVASPVDTAPDAEPDTAPRPRIIHVPDVVVPETEIRPSVLSHAVRLRAIDPETAREIAPLVERLGALRDDMARARRPSGPD